MTKIEKKILDFIEKHLTLLFIIIITLLALYIRYKALPFKSEDYNHFLMPWFDSLKEAGGLKGLSTYQGDYNAPYITLLALLTYIPKSSLVLIKSLSILFDFLLAISSTMLVKELTKGKNKLLEVITYTLVIFLPIVLLNSSVWAQCDSIYASFIVLSLLFLVKKKYTLSFIMLGLSFSFKLQFIFILPLYIVLYFKEKEFSILNFLIIPAVIILLCIPSIIAGRSFLSCMAIYYHQTQTYKQGLVYNFNNLYNLIYGNVEYLYLFGEILTLIICGLALYYILSKKITFNNEKILTLGLWFIVITTYFLPGMHERYLFVGEILSIIIYLVYKKHLKLALFINFATLIHYAVFLFGINNDYMKLFSIIYLIIITLFTKETLSLLNEEETKKTSKN